MTSSSPQGIEELSIRKPKHTDDTTTTESPGVEEVSSDVNVCPNMHVIAQRQSEGGEGKGSTLKVYCFGSHHPERQYENGIRPREPGKP